MTNIYLYISSCTYNESLLYWEGVSNPISLALSRCLTKSSHTLLEYEMKYIFLYPFCGYFRTLSRSPHKKSISVYFFFCRSLGLTRFNGVCESMTNRALGRQGSCTVEPCPCRSSRDKRQCHCRSPNCWGSILMKSNQNGDDKNKLPTNQNTSNSKKTKKKDRKRRKKINKWRPSKSRQHIRGYCQHFRLLPNDDDNDNDNDYDYAAGLLLMIMRLAGDSFLMAFKAL